MVNATMLCKAGGKQFNDYMRNKQSQDLIEAIRSETGIPVSKIVETYKGGDVRFQGSWIHRLIAIDCARWLNPRFSLQIMKWTDEILTKGSVQIEKPLLPMVDRNAYDLEAEQLEKEVNPILFSNTFSLYIAYIGEEGLLKIGSSDCRLKEREQKHNSSCETLYPQFRFIGIFPISSGIMESKIHSLLDKYRYAYQKQKEVYRPDMPLKSFLDMIKNLLEENDLKYQFQKAKQEIMELRIRNAELELRLLKMEQSP